MRTSTMPLVENEALVLVRASFLALCDGNHCAAALLNNFVYWHDWCVAHGRYDTTATIADPHHQPVDPEYWFWKTTDDLVNDDLLGLWGEKKVRAAAELLEAKGYAQSRFNPKNRYDRTKQYRLVAERLAADLQRWAAGQERRDATDTADLPNAFGKNAECTPSTTYSGCPIRPKCRMDAAKPPDVQTETTCSETTDTVGSSSSSMRSPAEMTREDPIGLDGHRNGRRGLDSRASFDMPAVAALILEWASERGIRRRRDDRSYGSPDLHWAVQWGTYCEERQIRARYSVFEVMDRAKAAADTREQWRFWKYLNEQVQHAAEQYAVAAVEVPPPPEQVAVQRDEDPNSEWAQVKSILADRLDSIAYANWIARTYQIGRRGTTLRVWVPDSATEQWLESEYTGCIGEALASVGSLKLSTRATSPKLNYSRSVRPKDSENSRGNRSRSVHATAVSAGQPVGTWAEADCSEAPPAPN